MRTRGLISGLGTMGIALAGCAAPAVPVAPAGTPTGPTAVRAVNLAGATDVPVATGRTTRLALVSTRDEALAVTVLVDGAGGPSAPVVPRALGPGLLGGTTFGPVQTSQRFTVDQRRYRVAQAAEVAVGDARTFWVIRPTRRGGASDRQVTARAVYVGSHAEIYVDRASGTSLDARATAIGETFDARIYPQQAAAIAEPIPPPGGSRRVAILISPEVNANGRDATIGYFVPRDLLAPADGAQAEHSNQRMLLYVASDVVRDGLSGDYVGTVAHEYQHLINATHKLFAPGARGETEDTWLDEGLATYAMQVTGFGLDSDAQALKDHVRGYLQLPEAFSLTQWDLNPSKSAYGAAFLFLMFLTDRHGPALARELVAAQEIGMANLTARLATRGTTPAAEFRDWALANALAREAPVPDARYAYRSIDLAALGVAASSSRVTVPGGGRLELLPWSATYLAFVDRSTQPGLTLSLKTTVSDGLAATLLAPGP